MNFLNKGIENIVITLFQAILNHFLKKYDFGTHEKTVEFLMKERKK